MSDGMNNTTHPESRSAALARLAAETPDVLIIGGGIVGAGVARDAALRGLKTALVDAHDFAFGTSSRSSRLLHGGLRYLAQGRVGLVREASVEKMIIHRIAPHLADPLPFIFPTYQGTDWKLWKLRLGVKIYDLLCGRRNLGKSTGLSRDQTLQSLPTLRQQNLTGAVRYYDGLTNDARLVLDTLRSAAAAGANLLNYTRVTRIASRDKLWHATLEDQQTGRSAEVSARSIVNAAGAWATGLGASRVKLRLTKGIHLVIDRAKLPVNDAVVLTEGTRILFVIPWGQRIILGTTDTDYTGPTHSPLAEPADIQYILNIVNAHFPTASLATADVISAWSGLRPLIANPNGKPSDISRAHEIRVTEPGWIDVAGGKLTTYRLMAEQTVDRLVSMLDARVNPCQTAHRPLLPPDQTRFSGILPPAVSRDVVEHCCREEWTHHLDDMMIRRTSWTYFHPDHLDIAQTVGKWMAEELAWSPERLAAELTRYQRITGVPGLAWEPPAGGAASISDPDCPSPKTAAAPSA